MLEMRNITKEFPGVKALDGVSLTVRPGTVHALMGENGAGKSTLMKCLFGIYAKDEGTIVLDGKEVDFKNSKEALEGGVAMVHQELNQALKRTVMENLWLGRYPLKFANCIDEKKMYKELEGPGLSETTIHRLRRQALKNIQDWYNAGRFEEQK